MPSWEADVVCSVVITCIVTSEKEKQCSYLSCSRTTWQNLLMVLRVANVVMKSRINVVVVGQKCIKSESPVILLKCKYIRHPVLSYLSFECASPNLTEVLLSGSV